MPVITLTLSWKENIVAVPGQADVVYHFPGHPREEVSFYRRPMATSQLIKKGGWRIEICENECTTSTDWSPYKFKRMEVSPRGVNGAVVKWLLTREENRLLETGTSGDSRNWNMPPMQLVTQYLGILEGKGCDIVGSTSMFCGEGTGPVWMWTLTF